MRNSLLLSVVIAIAGVSGVAAPDAPARQPNVIFILTDDQGWGDG